MTSARAQPRVAPAAPILVAGLVAALAGCATARSIEGVVAGGARAERLVARGAVATRIGSDGTLTIAGGPGYVFTASTYQDVAVRLEVRAGASNSGIFVRGAHPTLGFFPVGPEVQIEHAGDPWSTGAIYGAVASSASRPSPDAWVELCVVARGDRLTTFVDGARAATGRIDEAAGFVAVQGHDPFGEVAVRRLRLRPLTEGLADDEQVCGAAW